MQKIKVKTIYVDLEDNNVYGLLYVELGIFLVNKNFKSDDKIVHIY